MPSDKPLLQTKPELDAEQQAFLASNQAMLEQLATFADFAPERLTLGFVSVNFTKDRDTVLKAVRRHPRCQEIQFATLHFPGPELRFLRDTILEKLPTIEQQPGKKLVLVITGLEDSIGMIGDAPPALQDLNYVRDSFTASVPYPMLICLPDWSLTRLARHAPDFWAWRLAVFRFNHLPTTATQVKQEMLDSPHLVGSLNRLEQQAQIDLLERLLMEYDADKPSDAYDCKTHIDILSRLGEFYDLQGKTEQAEQVWTQALRLVPVPSDPAITASQIHVLHGLASVMWKQGDVELALQLFQQSLELSERTGDVQGKAATLGNMAGVIAAQGDIEQALQLWNQSLELSERIGNVQGKAVTLGNMANIAYQQGEAEQAAALLKQSVQALGQTRAYVDFVTGLGNLAVIDAGNQFSYLSQAIWLCLRIQVPLVDTVQYIRNFFNAVPQGDAVEMLLAATALWFCNTRGDGHPQLEQLQENSMKMISAAANAQGIQTQEAFDAWVTQQQLNDPNFFLPQLNQRLEDIIGDGWLFDLNAVTR